MSRFITLHLELFALFGTGTKRDTDQTYNILLKVVMDKNKQNRYNFVQIIGYKLHG